MANMGDMKILVVSLAAYNNSALHQIWVDLAEEETMLDQIEPFMKECPFKGEEWAIHDSEGFGDFEIKEGTSLSELEELYHAMEQNDEDVVLAAAKLHGIGFLSETLENYVGEFSSDEAFAQDLCEECGYIPKDLPDFISIDWEQTAASLMMNHYEHDGHYFRAG